MSWYNKFPATCEYSVPVNLTYKMAEVIPVFKPLVLEVNAHCDLKRTRIETEAALRADIQHILDVQQGWASHCTFYTGCNRRNVRDFGRVFLRSNYTDITQNTYIQS